MQYKKLQEQLELIKTQIMTERDEKKLKQLLREKLNEIGILLYEYTSPMLTAVRQGKNANQNHGKVGRGTLNIGFVTNNNCPDDLKKNSDFFLNSEQPNLRNLEINSLGMENVTDLNNMIKNNI